MATAHTHQVIFGRKVAGCPRCTELRLGMPPVRWSTARADADYQRLQAIRLIRRRVPAAAA